MRFLDRLLAGLLALGAAGHTAGSLEAYGHEPLTLLWALCGSLLALLLAALNLLRAARPNDRTLAWLTAAGTAAWLAVSAAFGILIGNLLDPRPLVFILIAAGLLAFSLRTALRRPQ